MEWGIVPCKITLVDEETHAPLAYVAGTGSNPPTFKGLIKSRSYSVYGAFLGSSSQQTFTAQDVDNPITIQFNKKIVWVSSSSDLYQIVVADARSPRDGRFIEEVGFYNPMGAKEVKINEERVKH